MMEMETRKVRLVPVISKYVLNLNFEVYQIFCRVRDRWRLGDCLRSPGPVQYSGQFADLRSFTLELSDEKSLLTRDQSRGLS